MWLFLGLLSAFLLGTYDIWKKVSLQNNAVVPVLFASVSISGLLLVPFIIVSRVAPEWMEGTIFFVPAIDLRSHLLLFLKAAIVLTSWLLAYFALKNLPITIVTPIRSTQPIWTVLGGVLIFGEQLNTTQVMGVVITLFSFILFSMVGKKEGISFRHNKWIWCIVAATLTGTASALFDKYLMMDINHMAVLSYYMLYQVPLIALVTLILWYPNRKKTTSFQFRGSIILISVFLVAADFVYFYALSMPDSLISVLSPIRRSGVIIPFLYGAIVMGDKNIKPKILCLLGVLLGIVCLFL